MNTWLKYLLPLSIISINGWAAEPYQMQLPLKPSVLVEAAQKTIYSTQAIINPLMMN